MAATIHHANEPDSTAMKEAITETAGVLFAAGMNEAFQEVVADKGYHKAGTLAWTADRGIRSYVPEKQSKQRRKWTDKPAGWQRAYMLNRRRVNGSRSAELQRLRSERVERSFAHTCRTGRARRTWLRGLVDVSKRYLIHVAAHNIGRIMRSLIGIGTPRGLQGPPKALRQLATASVAASAAICAMISFVVSHTYQACEARRLAHACSAGRGYAARINLSSTGC